MEEIEHKNNLAMERLADDWGIDSWEYDKKVTERLRKLVNNSHFYTRIEEDVLQKVLKHGRFKNQFESGMSSGLFNPTIRARIESKVLGIDRDESDPRKRPIYGYVSSQDFKGFGTHSESSLIHYGNVAVKLKNDIKGRSTVTLGDSLDNSRQLVASPASKASSISIPMSYSGRASGVNPNWKLSQEEFLFGNDDEAAGTIADHFAYIEAQYHKPLTALDIEEVMFMDPPEPRTQRLLEKRGIKWRTMY